MTERTDAENTYLAATLVMGWKPWAAFKDVWLTGDEDNPSRKWFNPLESIADAWIMAEKLGLDVIKVDDGWMAGDGSGGFSDDDGFVEMQLTNFVIASTAPRAITLAAIGAVEKNS